MPDQTAQQKIASARQAGATNFHVFWLRAPIICELQCKLRLKQFVVPIRRASSSLPASPGAHARWASPVKARSLRRRESAGRDAILLKCLQPLDKILHAFERFVIRRHFSQCLSEGVSSIIRRGIFYLWVFIRICQPMHVKVKQC